MKAQLVYENLDFERGISPKKALGIGRKNWDNLGIGDVIYTKEYVPQGLVDNEILPPAAPQGEKMKIIPPNVYMKLDFWRYNPKKKRFYVGGNTFYGKDSVIDDRPMGIESFESPEDLMKHYFGILQRSDLKEGMNFERGFKSDSREDILDRVLNRKITLELDAANVFLDDNGQVDKNNEENDYFLDVIEKSGAEWTHLPGRAWRYGGVPFEFKGTKEQLIPIIAMWDAHSREPEELAEDLEDWDGTEKELWEIIG